MKLKGRIDKKRGVIELIGGEKELEWAKNVLDDCNICEDGCYRAGEDGWEVLECESCWVNGMVNWEEKVDWNIGKEKIDQKEEEKEKEKEKIDLKLDSGKKKTLIFDFDGVIHKGYKGYKDGSIYGEIDKELIEWMAGVLKRYEKVGICVVSNRDKKQIVEFMNRWCKENKIDLEWIEHEGVFWEKDGMKIGVSNRKVAGVIYVDDKGYRWEGLEKLKEDLGLKED